MNSRPLAELGDEELWRLFPIVLEEYREGWKDDFRREAEALGAVEGVLRVTHIGSTAVPGLVAKPTVDILMEIEERADLGRLTAAMESSGYIVSPQPAKPAPHVMFLKGYTPAGFRPPVVHVHVRYAGDWDEIRFRDYLRAHPEAAREYGDLKRRLHRAFEHDRDGYTEAKTEFVRRIAELAGR